MLKKMGAWFVSVDPNLDADLYWKSLIFVYMALAMVVALFFELAVISAGLVQIDLPLAYLTIAIISIIAIFKFTKDLKLSMNLLVLVLFLSLYTLSFDTGKIFSMDLILLLFVPVLAFLIGNFKSGVIWYIIVSLCAIYQFVTTDPAESMWKNGVEYSTGFYLVACLVFYFLASSLAFVFSFLNNKYLTRVKKQNEQIRLQTHDLKLAQEKVLESNRELEQYAYVTSHDLKQPLRTIVSFSKLLKRDLQAGIVSKDSLKFMDFIESSAENMDHLIEDILEYSQLSMDQNEQYDYCEIGSVIDSAIGNLQNQIQKSKAIIDVSGLSKNVELPLMTSRIVQLFQNIISNGMKYNEANRASKISVSSIEKDNHWLFTITDNGIGIPNKHLTSIFQPFKRLHAGQEKFKGTGIGLATCDRIVEQHGGKIWVESEVNVGSKFSFTLSKTLLNNESDNDSYLTDFNLKIA